MQKMFRLALLFIFFFHTHTPVYASATTAVPSLNYFLGTPYMVNPLGEGSNAPYTPQPLSRKDAFDCTTYVEMLLAQKKAQAQGNSWQEHLKKLRYIDGKIDFFYRTHVMEYHWIPNAIAHNFIAPLSFGDAQLSQIQMDLQHWFSKHDAVRNKDIAYEEKVRMQPKRVQASIAYVPATAITPDFLRTLPPSTVAFFLKKLPKNLGHGRNKGDILITHMGLVQGKYLYHASQRHKKVQKIPLLNYLQAHPLFVGVSFYKVL